MTLEKRLEKLALDFAAQVAREVRQAFAAQVGALVAGNAPARRGRPAGGSGQKRTYPPHCLKCNKAHGGPRSSFTCEDHRDLPKGEKRALLSAWKEKQG
jgi:hypothetical protein